jgi:AcrR family transcriptional regulator
VVSPDPEQLALGVHGDVVGVGVADPPDDQPGGDLAGFGFRGERSERDLGDLGVTDPLLQLIVEDRVRVVDRGPGIVRNLADGCGDGPVLAGRDAATHAMPAGGSDSVVVLVGRVLAQHDHPVHAGRPGGLDRVGDQAGGAAGEVRRPLAQSGRHDHRRRGRARHPRQQRVQPPDTGVAVTVALLATLQPKPAFGDGPRTKTNVTAPAIVSPAQAPPLRQLPRSHYSGTIGSTLRAGRLLRVLTASLRGSGTVSGKKQFDEEVALGFATEQFRHGGYAPTSIDDLAKATGLSRSSIYTTFGTKEEFFLRVLNRYCDQMMQRLVPAVDVPPSVSLRKFLGDLGDALQGWGRPGGCLVTNTCGDAGSTPDAVRQRITRALEEQTEQLEVYLAGAQQLGQLLPSADIKQLASFFVALRQSLGVLWRAGSPRTVLDDVIEVSLAVLPLDSRQLTGARR